MVSDIIRPGRRVSVTGNTGAGKTYWLKRELARGRYDLLVYDPENEYAPGSSLDLVGGLEAFDIVRAAKDRRRAVAIIASSPKSREQMHEDVAILAQAAMERRDLVLVIEEAGEVAKRHEVPPELWTVSRRGRKYGVGLVLSSQRITDVDRDLSSQSDSHVIFHLGEHHDQQEARKRWGPSAQASIQRLGVGQYYIFPDDAKHFDINVDKLIPSRGELVRPMGSSEDDPNGSSQACKEQP